MSKTVYVTALHVARAHKQMVETFRVHEEEYFVKHNVKAQAFLAKLVASMGWISTTIAKNRFKWIKP